MKLNIGDVVVCYVTRANPPLQVVEGFVRKIWKDQVIDKIGMVNRGVFLVRFASKKDQDKACNMNGILFDKKPFIVKPCIPKISYDKASLSTVPVWVNAITGHLRKVLREDDATLTKSRLMYSCVFVDMNISKGFPKEFFYSNKHDELIAQQVQYD